MRFLAGLRLAEPPFVDDLLLLPRAAPRDDFRVEPGDFPRASPDLAPRRRGVFFTPFRVVFPVEVFFFTDLRRVPGFVFSAVRRF